VTLTLTLLAPLGLAALVALGVPILIHLVRRIELRTTEFAALRWISDRVRPRRPALRSSCGDRRRPSALTVDRSSFS